MIDDNGNDNGYDNDNNSDMTKNRIATTNKNWYDHYPRGD